MEFSRPSCFLREIDPRYVRRRLSTPARSVRARPQDAAEGPSAHRRTAPPLRRTASSRNGQADRAGGNNGGQQVGFGGRGSSLRRRSADGQSGPARRFARAAAPQGARPAGRPDPALVQTPRPSTHGMRRVGVRQAVDGGVPVGNVDARQRRLHRGPARRTPQIRRAGRSSNASKPSPRTINWSSAFDSVGEKTLLAKFAKLTKL